MLAVADVKTGEHWFFTKIGYLTITHFALRAGSINTGEIREQFSNCVLWSSRLSIHTDAVD